MPNISIKGNLMPESPIRKLVPFADEAQKKGRTIYHLNIGQPDIISPNIALNAIRNNHLKVIAYSNSAGNLSYREKLTDYYKKIDIHLTSSEIIITTGGSEAIVMAFMTCLNPGDELIIPEPFYANYNGFAIMAGIKVIPVTASIENGFALPPIAEFKNLITDKTKGILICNPGNPTGYLYSEEELISLSELVINHDLYLFADEAYREFCYDGAKHISAMHLEKISQNVVLFDSISKRYSMCGARIGALISHNKQVMATAMKFAQARLSPPTFGQIAGEAALDTDANYFEEVNKEYLHRRNVLVEGLQKIKGVLCPIPQGAFYCVVRLPIDNSDKFCRWLLEDFCFENQTVMLAPASGFYATKGYGTNEVRIAYVLKVENLRKAIICLDEALKVYPGRTI